MSTSWFVRELSCQQVDCQRVDVSARCLSPVYDWHHNHRILIMRLHVIDLGWVENVRFTLRYVVSAGTGRLQLWDLWISVVFTIDVFWFLSWNRLISNCIYWKFRYIYIYCLVIGLFNGQFRFSENLMYEKIFAQIIFADSLQWPVCNYLLCNKQDSWHFNYIIQWKSEKK